MPHGALGPKTLRRLRTALAVVCLGGTAAVGDDAAVSRRLDALGGGVRYKAEERQAAGTGRRITEIVVADGSELTPEDLTAFAGLSGLRKLQIHNCRSLDDAAVEGLAGNSGVTDAAVATIVASFPGLVDLDLSSNTNLTGAALRSIAGLAQLERLNLMQCRFNDIHTRRLAKLPELEVLDLRGNMEAGDLTLGVLGRLPKLRVLKHRSSSVTDDGLARLAESRTLESLLAQDFLITDAAGEAGHARVAGDLPLPGLRLGRRAVAGVPEEARAAHAPRPPRRRRRRPGRAGRAARTEAALSTRTGVGR
jgi:hypothetical protein